VPVEAPVQPSEPAPVLARPQAVLRPQALEWALAPFQAPK
jgi:hypothetical protein